MTIKEKGKLLAINFGGIGDEILFLPTLASIRQALPQWSISLLLEPRSKSFSDLTDLIDDTITFDIKKRPLTPKDLVELLSLLRSGAYDIVLSSGSSMMVSGLLFLSGIPIRIGYNSNGLAPLLLTGAAPLDRNTYAGQMYHSLAETLHQKIGFTQQKTDALFKPTINVGEASKSSMKAFLEEAGILDRDLEPDKRETCMILLHPGTSRLALEKGIFKTWSSENWTSLAQTILTRGREDFKKPAKIVLAGGPDDKAIIEDIKEKMQDMEIISAFGITKSLKDLSALILLSDLFVCVDSAPMHVAAALDKELVALFGPTNPHLLLPESKKFAYLWDNKDGNRSMFDRQGVELEPGIVYDTIKEMLS